MADEVRMWVLEPRTHPDDPGWQDRRIWSRVLVAARSPAFARLVAEEWALDDDVRTPGNESPSRIAGFRDEKLYSIRPARMDELTGNVLQESCVISADLLIP
jgi:hypothetical protein